MKYLKLTALLLIAGCIKNQTPTPIVPSKYLDIDTRRDTIIVNPGGVANTIYYAIENWESYPDSNAAVGYRQVIGETIDSIYVAIPNDLSGKYYGPYQLSFNQNGDTLKTQNFLDTIYNKPSRIFVLQQ